jgi:hypothetical protein
MQTYTCPLTSFTPRYVLTLQTLAAAPATMSAVAMPNALSEYKAPLKLPSVSTLDTRKDACPEGTRNTLLGFANGAVCADAPSVPREDRGIAVIPPWCDRGGGARLLTGGEDFNFDVDVNREDVRPSPPMIELAARSCRRRKARGRARAALVTASWREVES